MKFILHVYGFELLPFVHIILVDFFERSPMVCLFDRKWEVNCNTCPELCGVVLCAEFIFSFNLISIFSSTIVTEILAHGVLGSSGCSFSKSWRPSTISFFKSNTKGSVLSVGTKQYLQTPSQDDRSAMGCWSTSCKESLYHWLIWNYGKRKRPKTQENGVLVWLYRFTMEGVRSKKWEMVMVLLVRGDGGRRRWPVLGALFL